MKLEAILAKLKEHTPEILGSKKFSKYAVMVPLVLKGDEVHVLFEVRSLQLKRQPGEICFPGGKIDSHDEDAEAAAIRETNEELRIDREEISKVYPLDYMVSPFGMIIYPYAGFIKNLEKVNPNPSEVGEVFTVPLSFFFEKEPEIYHIEFKMEPEKNFPFDLIVGGENYNWRARGMEEYFYLYEDKVIWGLTARILAHFIELIRGE
ncbi:MULTISPECIES: NUDIX hydrolase [Neobacillus]|uniref:CoA pyrophosphatase n=1 Tax=Neobacillus rhizophilus TaxID=2833579 RepID=A0A942U7G5_9BACI|nr:MULTISPECIES: CoA pyrophosphatase [Neobacillus]MBS4216081.1 CoA pyrophosphatase [Neobacillus rhizophilus]MBU8919925.1 CoA pyrophosphatase [Bacillus sp. FJAT-29953]